MPAGADPEGTGQILAVGREPRAWQGRSRAGREGPRRRREAVNRRRRSRLTDDGRTGCGSPLPGHGTLQSAGPRRGPQARDPSGRKLPGAQALRREPPPDAEPSGARNRRGAAPRREVSPGRWIPGASLPPGHGRAGHGSPPGESRSPRSRKPPAGTPPRRPAARGESGLRWLATWGPSSTYPGTRRRAVGRRAAGAERSGAVANRREARRDGPRLGSRVRRGVGCGGVAQPVAYTVGCGLPWERAAIVPATGSPCPRTPGPTPITDAYRADLSNHPPAR
ncbi:hypothetical protein a10_06209 [Streptomyces acidiscabies]|nr:hypothetical protein a10_06209 [Streptomyces acidiscabies]GAV44091.1 hypothetical protein Saa2_07050 [Streptomyces acidiscabies]